MKFPIGNSSFFRGPSFIFGGCVWTMWLAITIWVGIPRKKPISESSFDRSTPSHQRRTFTFICWNLRMRPVALKKLGDPLWILGKGGGDIFKPVKESGWMNDWIFILVHVRCRCNKPQKISDFFGCGLDQLWWLVQLDSREIGEILTDILN